MQGRFAFHTAIAATMELVNEAYRLRASASPGALRFALASAASLIFAFAPHCGAEVYEALTGERVWEQPWPQANPDLLEEETFELVVQVNGRVRDRLRVPADASREDLLSLARERPNVQAHLDGREIVKEVVVPGRLVNLVIR
jgi:leucyl-tRNA synthetase